MTPTDMQFHPDRITFALEPGARTPRSGKPNVVVFYTDQQRWDTTGVHGNPLGLTPNFDRVARTGTHLEHSFTVQPVCGPSRACLQTGRYATQSGCFHNEIPLPEHQKTLAHHFNDAGYTTGYVGKWHLADHEPVGPRQRGGYQRWLAANKLEFTSDAYHTVVFDEAGDPVKLPGYRVDALTDAAIRFIDEHQDEPFFLFLSHIEPHHQNHVDAYPAPTGYRERYEGLWIPPDLAALGGSTHQQIAGYYGMVKRLDEAFGRLLDALESLGLSDNTVVLFTSDHGNHFKTRNTEYKRSGHEASIRVPTVLQGPGFERGGHVAELTDNLDLSATLLDAAGIAVPSELAGRSVLPLLRSERPEWRDEILFQSGESTVERGLRTARWKYGIVAPEADPSTNPHADRFVEAYLFDLAHDPHELFNLIGQASHAEVAANLRERLRDRMREIGEPKAEIAPAPQTPRYRQREALPGEQFE